MKVKLSEDSEKNLKKIIYFSYFFFEDKNIQENYISYLEQRLDIKETEDW